MMKKLLLLFFVAFIYVNASNAQSLSLSWEGQPLADTSYVWANPNDDNAATFHAIVTNNSDKLVNVKVLRTNIDVTSGSSNSFCFASQCYPPFTDESPDYVILSPGESNPDDDFHGDFLANGVLGNSTVEYKFFDKDNPDDYVKAVVIFWSSPDAIDENIINSMSISDAYPNPAHNTFHVDYNFEIQPSSAQLRVVNLLGSVVKETDLDRNANRISMDISDLNAGIYFY